MESRKKSLLKTLSWEAFHLIGVAGIIAIVTYSITGQVEYEYATLGALGYILWESLGYFLHERIWAKFGEKVK